MLTQEYLELLFKTADNILDRILFDTEEKRSEL